MPSFPPKICNITLGVYRCSFAGTKFRVFNNLFRSMDCLPYRRQNRAGDIMSCIHLETFKKCTYPKIATRFVESSDGRIR